MRRHILLTALDVLITAGAALADSAECADGACAVTPGEATWAQVATGVQGGTIKWPRNPQGAELLRVDLTRQAPLDGEATVCDGRQEATARYGWKGQSVTFKNVTVAGTDCAKDDPVRFRCATTTVQGLGRTRDCTSSKWRIITWGGYVPRKGGQFELSGPRAFALVPMARSVR